MKKRIRQFSPETKTKKERMKIKCETYTILKEKELNLSLVFRKTKAVCSSTKLFSMN